MRKLDVSLVMGKMTKMKSIRLNFSVFCLDDYVANGLIGT